MEDIHTLKEMHFSERKSVLEECWYRNLAKVQMRSKETEAMSIGNAFQKFSYSGEQANGVKKKFFTKEDLRE